MFANALKKVQEFTFPVIMCKRLVTGEIQAACATFVVLNPEGWVITASHVIGDLRLSSQHQSELREYNNKVEDIRSDAKHTEKQREHKLKSMPRNPQWITNISCWWGMDGLQIVDFIGNDFLDIAVGRLTPFDSGLIKNYPVLKNPAGDLSPGTSLCRLGFPFHNVEASFNETSNQFTLKEGTLPVPFFPIEGIHTRVARKVNKEGTAKAKFIETSSPGLRGQSGGPIFDIQGNVWGIQSGTFHFSLGFNPKIKKDNKEIEEHQFLNIGFGLHVEEIIRFLTAKGISFGLSP